MKQYKMAFLDRLDFVVTTRLFEAAGDGDALAHAYSLCGTHQIAVTQDGRRVGEVARGALPSGAYGAVMVPAVTAPARRRQRTAKETLS